MRIEWKEGTRLTKKRALFLCWKLWEWLAETGNFAKDHWPHWDWNNGKVDRMWQNCPCCQWCVSNGETDEEGSVDCTACLLRELWPFESTDDGAPCQNKIAPFGIWEDEDSGIDTRKKYARLIANFAKKEYEKCR